MRYYVKDKFFLHAVDLLYNSGHKYWSSDYVGLRSSLPDSADLCGPIRYGNTAGEQERDIFEEIAGCIPMRYVAVHLPESKLGSRIRNLVNTNPDTLGRLSSLYGMKPEWLKERYKGCGEAMATTMLGMKQSYIASIELYMHKEERLG